MPIPERPPDTAKRRRLPVPTASGGRPHPREFRQAGIERFGDRAREEAEAETIAIVIKAIELAGLKDWSIRLGDLGLFSSVLDVAGLSPRWKKRLDDAFLKPLSFREALKTFAVSARSASASVPDALLSSLRRDDRAASEAAVAAYLDEKSISSSARGRSPISPRT